MSTLFCHNSVKEESGFGDFISLIESETKHFITMAANFKSIKEKYTPDNFEFVIIDYRIGNAKEIEDFILSLNFTQKIILANYPIDYLFKNCCTYKLTNKFRSISSIEQYSKLLHIIKNFESISCSDNKIELLKDYIDDKISSYYFDINKKEITLKIEDSSAHSIKEYVEIIELLDDGSISYNILSDKIQVLD